MRVRVTKADIRDGQANDCWTCPVARALQRATLDESANVYQHDWQIYLEVGCRSILAPERVAQWVRRFDNEEVGDRLTFDLPPFDSPDWLEKCQHCGTPCDAESRDEDGFCEDCQQPPEGD